MDWHFPVASDAGWRFMPGNRPCQRRGPLVNGLSPSVHATIFGLDSLGIACHVPNQLDPMFASRPISLRHQTRRYRNPRRLGTGPLHRRHTGFGQQETGHRLSARMMQSVAWSQAVDRLGDGQFPDSTTGGCAQPTQTWNSVDLLFAKQAMITHQRFLVWISPIHLQTTGACLHRVQTWSRFQPLVARQGFWHKHGNTRHGNTWKRPRG